MSKIVTKKKRKKNGGFTLIELLATITILAIVSVIVVYSATNIISKTKENSYKVSISNIEQNSGAYVTENQSNLNWLPVETDSTSEYFCVTVKDLIDLGYFDNEILKSKISDDRTITLNDYIYLKRNATTKTIVENRLLTESESEEYCDDITSAGVINFTALPTGWSNQKNVTINYQILNFNGTGRDYTYYYLRDDTGEVVQTEFTNSTKELVVENFSGNSIIAKIYQGETELASKTFSPKIDAEKPILEVSVEDGDIFKRNNYAYLKLVDTESGFRKGNYKVYYEWSKEPLRTCDEIKASNKSVELYVSEDYLKESESYGVYISNYNGVGKVYACADDSVTDSAGNKATNIPEAIMKLDNDRPTVTIGNYTPTTNARGSVTLKLILTEPTSSIDYNSFNKNDIEIKIGSTSLNTEKIDLTKTNEVGSQTEYTLVIRNTEYDGQVTIKIAENKFNDIAGNSNIGLNKPLDIIFKNTYMINYNGNGGSGSMLSTECNYNMDCQLETNKFTYNGREFLNWNTSSNGNGTTYNNKVSGYDNDGDLTLYAQWKTIIYTITYNLNGGTMPSSGVVTEYNIETPTFNLPTPTKQGSKFLGWYTGDNGTGSKVTQITKGTTGNKTYYALWEKYTVTIKYHVNGGSIATSSNDNGTWTSNEGIVYRNGAPHVLTIAYGETDDLTNYNNTDWVNISRTGYTVKSGEEWICLEGCTTSGKKFDQVTEYQATEFCDIAAGDCTVTLGVNWIASGTYFIYNKNASDATGTMESTKYTYNERKPDNSGYKQIPVSVNKFSRSGYIFDGWHLYREADNKWFGCTNSSACSGSNTTIGWHNKSEIKTFYKPISKTEDNPWMLSSSISNTDVTFYAQWLRIYCTGSSYLAVASDNATHYNGRICFAASYDKIADKSTVYVVDFQVKSSNPGYYNLYMDGFVKVNGQQAHRCNSKAHGPQCLVYWYYNTDSGWRTPSKIEEGTIPVTVTGKKLTFTLTGLNYEYGDVTTRVPVYTFVSGDCGGKKDCGDYSKKAFNVPRLSNPNNWVITDHTTYTSNPYK